MIAETVLHVIDGRVVGGGELYVHELQSKNAESIEIVAYRDYLRSDDCQHAKPVFHNHILMWKSIVKCLVRRKEFDIFIHSDFFFAYSRLGLIRRIMLWPAYIFTIFVCKQCEIIYASSVSRLPEFVRIKTIFSPPVLDYSIDEVRKRPVFVWVGRLNISRVWGDIKGVRTLIRIAKKYPEFEFLVYGSGSSSNLLKGIDNLELRGFVTNLFQELDPNIHVLLATSESEGFGRVVHEASRRGLTSYVTVGFPIEVTRLPNVIVCRDIEEELIFLNHLARS